MKRIKENCLKQWPFIWPYFIFMAVALFILWSQKNSRAFFVGYDSWFHMNQVYETAMQIKTGHFSWFLTLFSYGQVGRIVDALYGPVFSYLMGGLLLTVGTWARFEIIVSFLVLSLGGMTMYHLSRFVKLGRGLSLILGLIYMSSYPVTEWVNNQTFDGIGSAILPFIILEGVKLWKSHDVNILSLALVMAVVTQAHLLTAVVSVVALIPFTVASFVYCRQKIQFIRRLLITLLLYVLLTGNVWATMLDVFRGNNLIRPFPVTSMGDDSFSLGWNHGTLSLLNPVYVIIGIIVLALLITEWRRLTYKQRFIPLLSLLFIWLSSVYFPWTSIERKIPSLSQTLQFPHRFLGVGIILFLLTLGLGIKNLNVGLNDNALSFIILTGLIVIAAVSITGEESKIEDNVATWHSNRIFISDSSNFHPKMPLNRLRNEYSSKNLTLAPKNTIKSISDYLPSTQKSNAYSYRRIHPKSRAMKELFRFRTVHYLIRSKQRNRKHVTLTASSPIKSPIHFKKSVGNHRLMIHWHQPQRLAKRWTQIPAVKYRRTRVNVNGRYVRVKIDKIGAIHLRPRAGDNQVTLSYHASVWWKLMITACVISWLGIVCYAIFRIIKLISSMNLL